MYTRTIYIVQCTHTKVYKALNVNKSVKRFVYCSLETRREKQIHKIHLLHPSEFSSHPGGMPAPADRGGCKAGKLRDEIHLLLGEHRTERRTEVGVAVVLDPVDHQVVAVAQAGQGGWPGGDPTPHSHFVSVNQNSRKLQIARVSLRSWVVAFLPIVNFQRLMIPLVFFLTFFFKNMNCF